ncbi:MAG: hypothetical protein JW821_15165, partial [Deltaproteobacteria bacterium]|nr:hypothetical protein [Deltaproteobacteria bacterium]
MERDFTFTTYAWLLEEILRTGRPVFPLREYIRTGRGVPALFILRHDVDRRPVNALKMALLEHGRGVRTTYYFRVRPGVFKQEIIRRIADLGHEVGYHYEALDKARGDIRKAERIFAEELKGFRRIVEVDTAAMHGNPLSPRDNRELWRHVPLARYGLLGEAYLSVKDRGLFYVTDTGRGWNRTSRNL